MNVEPLLDEIVDRVAGRLLAQLDVAKTESSEPWRLFDLEEAAATLGRSTRWVRDRVKAGELVHVRLDGGALAFDPDDLREFARARRVDGTLAARLQGSREAHV